MPALFTPSAITNSSHASILTGLLPNTHRVTDFAVLLSPTLKELTELVPRLVATSRRIWPSLLIWLHQ